MRKEGEGRIFLVGTLLVVVVLVFGVVSVGAVWSMARLAGSIDTVSSPPAPVTELPTASPVREASALLAPSPTATPIPATPIPATATPIPVAPIPATATVTPAPVQPSPTTTTAPATAEPSPTLTTIASVPPATPSPTAEVIALAPSPTSLATRVPFAAQRSPTPIASQTRTPPTEDVIVSDTFDDTSSGWPVRERETWSARYVDGHYEMTLSGQPSSGSSTVFAAEHYRLRAEIAVFEGQGGLVFLSTPPATFYRLLFSTDGTYSIETITQGNDLPTVLVPPTAHPALKRGLGVSNRVAVERHAGTVQFFVNDQPLTEFLIPPGEYLNQYGFAIASPSGQARVTFDTIFGERLSG